VDNSDLNELLQQAARGPASEVRMLYTPEEVHAAFSSDDESYRAARELFALEAIDDEDL